MVLKSADTCFAVALCNKLGSLYKTREFSLILVKKLINILWQILHKTEALPTNIIPETRKLMMTNFPLLKSNLMLGAAYKHNIDDMRIHTEILRLQKGKILNEYFAPDRGTAISLL